MVMASPSGEHVERRGGGQQLLSKIATEGNHGENSLYFDGWKAYESDPYHPTRNPHGVIQMGLAENQLCFDLMEEWMKKHPEASICTTQGVSEFREVAIFQDYHGLPAFRNAVARFMERARGGRVSFDPDRIVMAGGATGANESLIFCLADPGDAFLVPTPYYPGFDRDLRWRTGIQLLPVHCSSANNFKLTRAAMEAAYQDALLAGVRVKGVILANPSNPLGTVLDRDTLASLLLFAGEKRIHLVCDEIYSATVCGNPGFVSVAEVLEELPPGGCDRDLVHIVYSLSKDLGLPGFRVGVVYSYNDEVVSCARKMSSFGLVSSQTQRLLASMLSDDEFVDQFMAENARRLSKRREAFTRGLAEVGIGCLAANAGLFLWMDLRPLLKVPTVEEETAVWRVIVEDVRLNVSPGSSFHCAEPGWFRVCVANMDEATVGVALHRMRRFVVRSRGTGLPVRRRAAAPAEGLRVSFSSLRVEDVCMSPRMMSPRLLSPCSPLVRATS